MTAFLLSFAKKYWGSAAILALAVVAGLQFASHERTIGRLQIQLARADSTIKAEAAAYASLAVKASQDSSRAAHLEADTAKQNAAYRSAKASYSALAASLGASRNTLDSLLALSHDSASAGLVGATEAYVQKSDSTIRACNGALIAADSALTACQDHAKALQANLLDVKGMLDAANKASAAKDVVIRATRQEVPSGFSVWGWRALSFAAGLLAGKIGE
jgi:hypothetical protein